MHELTGKSEALNWVIRVRQRAATVAQLVVCACLACMRPWVQTLLHIKKHNKTKNWVQMLSLMAQSFNPRATQGHLPQNKIKKQISREKISRYKSCHTIRSHLDNKKSGQWTHCEGVFNGEFDICLCLLWIKVRTLHMLDEPSANVIPID